MEVGALPEVMFCAPAVTFVTVWVFGSYVALPPADGSLRNDLDVASLLGCRHCVRDKGDSGLKHLAAVARDVRRVEGGLLVGDVDHAAVDVVAGAMDSVGVEVNGGVPPVAGVMDGVH